MKNTLLKPIVVIRFPFSSNDWRVVYGRILNRRICAKEAYEEHKMARTKHSK